MDADISKEIQDIQCLIDYGNEKIQDIEKLTEDKGPTQYTSTDNISLDIVVSEGKGLPSGNMLLFGDCVANKAVLALDTACRLLKKDDSAKILYMNTYRNTDFIDDTCRHYRIDRDRVILINVRSWDDVERQYTQVLKGDFKLSNVKVVILDNIKQVLPIWVLSKIKEDKDYKLDIHDYDINNKCRKFVFEKFFGMFRYLKIFNIIVSHSRTEEYMDFTILNNFDISINCNSLSKNEIEIETFSKGTKNSHSRSNMGLIFLEDNHVINSPVLMLMLKGKRVVEIKENNAFLNKEFADFLGVSSTLTEIDYYSLLEDREADIIKYLKETDSYDFKV